MYCSEVKRVGKEVCQERRVLKKVWQERRVCQVLGFRAVNKRSCQGKIQRWQGQTGSRQSGIGRKRCQGKRLDKQRATGRAVKNQRWQVKTESRENGIIRKGCREKEMSKRKSSKSWHSERPWQPGGQACPCRLSLFFIAYLPRPCRNFRHPPCPGSTGRCGMIWHEYEYGMMQAIYVCIYIYI